MSDANYDRFIETGEGLVVFRLENMPCPQCRYVTKDVSSCEKYVVKPSLVMEGKSPCPQFEAASMTPEQQEEKPAD